MFLCYWSTMDLTLQATQPLLLCNLYISSRIPKAAHIHSSRHLKLKARASLTMPAVLDDMEPQQWVPPLSVEDWRYSTQTDQHFLGKRNIQFLSLSAGAEQIWNVDVNPLTGWRSNNKIMRLSTNLYRWAWKFGLTAATSDESSCFWLEHHCMMLISFSLALCVSNVNKCWPVCIFMLTSSTVGIQLGPSTYFKLRFDYVDIKYETTAAALSLHPEKKWNTLP